jgi:hypothetical protein
MSVTIPGITAYGRTVLSDKPLAPVSPVNRAQAIQHFKNGGVSNPEMDTGKSTQPKALRALGPYRKLRKQVGRRAGPYQQPCRNPARSIASIGDSL